MENIAFKEDDRHQQRFTYQEFDQIPAFNKNRIVKTRVKKLYNKLSKGYLPTHTEFKVGLVTKDFDVYKIGDMFKLDGNTRTEVFRQYPNLIPNNQFNATVYYIDNSEYAYNLYRSIDSQTSVETGSDIMTGYVRYLNYIPKSEKFLKGRFKTALDMACAYAYDDNGTYLNSPKIEPNIKLKYYWDEFIYIDEFNIDRIRKMSSVLIAAIFMIGKKFGVEHPNFQDMLHKIKFETTTINHNGEVDGVHHTIFNLYEKHKDLWTAGSRSFAPTLLSKVLMSLTMYMNDEKINKNKPQTNISEEKLKEYYRNYFSLENVLV